MFERFGDSARMVVVDAQGHARRLQHNFIGCEHLLLAVACTDSEAGAVLRGAGLTPQAVEAATLRIVGQPNPQLDREALAAIGIDLDLVREKIEASFGPNAFARPVHHRRWARRRRSCQTTGGHLAFTARAKKCLELTRREAGTGPNREIGVEHIALGLTAMTDGVVPAIFAQLGASPAGLRAEVRNRYRQAS